MVKKVVKKSVRKAPVRKKVVKNPVAKKSVKKAPVKRAPRNPWEKVKSYIGLKQIDAVPMNRGAYVKFRNWALPVDEDPKDKGFMVRYPDGYISWSPQEQFEKAYMPLNNMDFSAALFCLKKGLKVARKGWNGKKMWLIMVPGSVHPKTTRGSAYKKAGLDAVTIDPHIDMMTARGTMQPGWLASQADMLATDWTVVN